MISLIERTAENLRLIREKKPLVHNITNFVVMNYSANVLLAMGASPVMAHAEQEVAQMVSYAGALVLNIGTLSEPWVRSMVKAGQSCGETGTPIVLDPVGSGATSFRTGTARKLIDECNVRIVRGNSSEILSLGTDDATTRGVDSVHHVDDAAEAACRLAQEIGSTVAITGPVDLITDGDRVIRVENGDPMMPYVTGTGCSATAVIGAFASVESDPVMAAAGGLAFFGLAGEWAARQAKGPGTFMISLLDALYAITPEDIISGCRITEPESRA
ncbi:MAG: hydroxyethylthiazole kinase [Proteobacteria bacterium]|nr:MAG: hydroxyethylthiazole kinase [Pseudomonadota bacterium]PIE64677.1 MAG: hydroxyethylthiazole kinase [Desulfobacterales bacterium]